MLADNGGGHIFDFLPQAGQVDEPTFEPPLPYARRARLRGRSPRPSASRYALVSEPAELPRLGAGDGGPMLLHATLDAEHNVALHRRLADAVAVAVAAAH